MFTVEYSNSGSYLWSRAIGGSNNDIGRSIALDAEGNIAVTGIFITNTDLGGIPLTSNGGYDAFLVKIQGVPSVVIPVDGQCWSTVNSCIAGTLNDIADNSTHYLWQCLGSNGGTTASCSLNKPSYTLTVSNSPSNGGSISGAGISCGVDCTESFVEGTVVTLTATANSGYAFSSWTNCDNPSGNICTETIDNIETITATFTANPINGQCGSTNNACTLGTLNDIADNSTHYLWQCIGLNGGTTASCSLAKSAYSLTLNKAGTGTGTVTSTSNPTQASQINCGTSCTTQAVSYVSGTVATLTASAASGSSFAGWSGACTGTGNCVVAMDAAKTVTATFDLILASFDFSLSNGGNKAVNIGSSVTNLITATLVSGTTQSVGFSASGLPAGATAGFNPGLCNPTCTSTITINTVSTTPSGAYTIIVTGTAGSVVRTTTFTLTVNKITPSLSISLSPSSTVNQGTQTIAAGNGCPSGLTCTLTRNGIGVSNPDIQTLAVGTYTYVYSTAGNTQYNSASATNILTVNSLVTVPSAPSNLVATTLSTTSIRLNWNDNSNNEDGFKIERATRKGAFIQIAVVGRDVITYTNSGLKKRTSYSYKVRAYNAAGNSAYSSTATTSTSTSFIQKVGEVLGI